VANTFSFKNLGLSFLDKTGIEPFCQHLIKDNLTKICAGSEL
jgi:hypothetical protein